MTSIAAGRSPSGARWIEAGRGWPLVLLHAFPLTADMWRDQLAAVPDGWRFIAPDLDAPAGPPTMDAYADAVFALLDHLHIDDCMVGGLSMGGYIAFAMHRRQPVRCTGFVLADTRAEADTAEGRDGREALRRTLAEGGVDAVADAMLPRLLSERARVEQPDVVARVREMIRATDPRRIDAAIVAMMGRPDATPQLDRLSVPVLVIAGDADEVIPPSVARAMRRRLPRALLAIIEGAGHLSNLERPEEFSRALHDFLLAHI
jgi:3-oxoadipate enol-lactonase